MEKIANDNVPLTNSEIEVKKNLAYTIREAVFTRLDIEEALKNLTLKQRKCFELVVMEGNTEAQAAIQLGISQQAVDKLVAKAKHNLKKILTGGC